MIAMPHQRLYQDFFDGFGAPGDAGSDRLRSRPHRQPSRPVPSMAVDNIPNVVSLTPQFLPG